MCGTLPIGVYVLPRFVASMSKLRSEISVRHGRKEPAVSITVGRFAFDGPYTHLVQLRDDPGVYAILDAVAGQYLVLDIGESIQVRTRVAYHDRQACWRIHQRGQLVVAVLYTGYSDRYPIEQELRREFQPLCGNR